MPVTNDEAPLDRSPEMFEVVLEIPKGMEGAADLIHEGVKAVLKANQREKEFPQMVIHEDTTTFRLKVRDETLVAGRMEEMNAEIERLNALDAKRRAEIAELEQKVRTTEYRMKEFSSASTEVFRKSQSESARGAARQAALCSIVDLVVNYIPGILDSRAYSDPQKVVDGVRAALKSSLPLIPASGEGYAYKRETPLPPLREAYYAAHSEPIPQGAPPPAPKEAIHPVGQRRLLLNLHSPMSLAELVGSLIPFKTLLDVSVKRVVDEVRWMEDYGSIKAEDGQWGLTTQGRVILAMTEGPMPFGPISFAGILRSPYLVNVSRALIRLAVRNMAARHIIEKTHPAAGIAPTSDEDQIWRLL